MPEKPTVRQTIVTSGYRRIWLAMFEPPWRNPRSDDFWRQHWIVWVIGWAWTLAGLVGGALVAPQFVKFLGLWDTPFQDALVISIAALAGFLVQFLAWTLLWLSNTVNNKLGLFLWNARARTLVLVVVLIPVVLVSLFIFLLPFIGVIYGLHLYFTSVGVNQRTVTVAFVGGLLVKTLLIPAIKAFAVGKAVRFIYAKFMRWLRGGKSA